VRSQLPEQGVIDALLAVKRHREHSAAAARHRRMKRLEQMTRERDSARERLRAFKAWRPREVQRLFDDLPRPASPQDLRRYRDACASLRTEELGLAEALDASQARWQQAHADYQQAVDRHRVTMRSREKFDEQADLWRDEQRRAGERSAEHAVEDLGPTRAGPGLPPPEGDLNVEDWR